MSAAIDYRELPVCLCPCRRTAPSARCEDRADGGSRDMVGVTTVWSTNAVPVLPSA
jgi:hypothetical protein